MLEERESIGVIAGGGAFPILVAEAARRRGCRTVAVAHEGETLPELAEHVDEIVWVRLGQLGALIRAFRNRGVRQVLMAGTISKHRMFHRVRPDLKGLSVMSRMAVFHDDGILRAVARELEKENIVVVPSTHFLPDLMAPQGVLTSRRPGKGERADIRFGWRMAKELGRLDIGQCVVVRRKTVVALEAMEGTDEVLRRAAKLVNGAAMRLVKVSRRRQHLLFDVPVVGLQTIDVMRETGTTALAVDAGQTLLLDRDELLDRADQSGITIVGFPPDD